MSFLLALLLGVFAMPALAGGRQVLADYEDNGQIDGCYTLADYEEALKLIRPDQQQYGAAVDVIRQAELTNIRRPGQACGATSAQGSSSDVPASAQDGADDATAGAGQDIEQDEGGLSAVAIAIIVAVGLAIIGFIIYLIASRRGGSGGDGSGDGGEGSGSA